MDCLDYTGFRNLGLKTSLWAFLFIFISCGKSDKPQDNATSGEITIACDFSYTPIAKALINVFESDYPRAKINLISTTEVNALLLLKLDSVQLVFVGNKLDSSLIYYFKKKRYKIEETQVAFDGIAFLANPKSTFLQIEKVKLRQLLTNKKSNVNLVIDKGNSSNYNFIKSWISPDTITENLFSATNFDEMVNYVSENYNAIGITGSSLISEDLNPTVQETLKKIEVIGIFNDSTREATYPYPDYFARNVYPFERSINMIYNANYFGLAKGFAAFSAGPKGQRIVLKFGLLPDRMPSRDVKIK